MNKEKLFGFNTAQKDSIIKYVTEATAAVDKQAATQADSTATDVAGLVTDFNALLSKLKAAGLMA